jgi:hypothetical protein
MKHQITRITPHQNAKVLALWMAACSILVLIPIGIIAARLSPAEDWTVWSLVLMPVFYLVIGYGMVWIGAVIYNAVAKYVGGMEYESDERG